MGPLRHADGEDPQFAQLYTVDPQHEGGTAEEFRVKSVGFGTALKTRAEKDRAKNMLREMDALMRQCNGCVRDCVTLYSMPAAQVQERRFILNADSRPAGEHARRYNRPEG